MRGLTIVLLSGLSVPHVPLLAKDGAAQHVVVSGKATEEVDPDIAIISFTVAGHGATSQEAARQLAAKQESVVSGLADLTGSREDITSTAVTMSVVREAGCARTGGYSRAEDCQIAGYAARISSKLRTRAVREVASLAARAQALGAESAQLDRFELADPDAVYRRANTKAVAMAKARAQDLAAALGGRIGRVIKITDESSRSQPRDLIAAETITVYAGHSLADALERVAGFSISGRPAAIVTTAQVFITFELLD